MLSAAELSTYRGFQFGMDLSAAAQQAGVKASDAKRVHQRPALIEELEWHPGGFRSSANADPIKEGLLCFYKGELYRIVVTYDRDRVAGMTADDMIAAISGTYGIATRPNAEIAYHSNYAEVAPVIARWQDSEYSYNLVRPVVATVWPGYVLETTGCFGGSRDNRGGSTGPVEAPQRAIEASQKQGG